MRSSIPSRWRALAPAVVLAALVALAGLAVPATAAAATSTFDRLEVIGAADFRNLTEVCDDGRTVTSRVRITGGHEEEAEDGVTTLDRDYLRVQIQSGCTGIIQVTTNEADFTWSPSLQTARVVGTFTTTTGQTIAVDISWEGTGPIEINQNNTSFPGRSATFVGRERDAVATGTVVLDGKTLVDGSTTNALLESLDDHIVATT
jgi:hypothetical protein